MIPWKPKGRKQQGCPRRTWKDGIYTAMNERDLRMGKWNNRRQWNMKVGRHHETFQNRAIYIYIYIYKFKHNVFISLCQCQKPHLTKSQRIMPC